MSCVYCGLDIPDDAPRCWACGREPPRLLRCEHCALELPFGAPRCPQCRTPASALWEYCLTSVRTGFDEHDKPAFRFCAEAGGPEGAFTAALGRWHPVHAPDRAAHQQDYEQMVQELREEYWHPQGPVPGGTWWEARFRRSIGDAPPGPRRNAV